MFHEQSPHLHNNLQNHCIDKWDCTISLRIKIRKIEDVIDDTLVVNDVMVVGIVVVDSINNHVRFDMYHQIEFDHQFKGQLFDCLSHTIQDRFDGVVPPSSSTHPCEKALQSIVVSCHHRKAVVSLIPLDAKSEKNERRLDIILAPTNPGDFEVGIVIESTNTALEYTSDLLKSMSKR